MKIYVNKSCFSLNKFEKVMWCSNIQIVKYRHKMQTRWLHFFFLNLSIFTFWKYEIYLIYIEPAFGCSCSVWVCVRACVRGSICVRSCVCVFFCNWFLIPTNTLLIPWGNTTGCAGVQYFFLMLCRLQSFTVKVFKHIILTYRLLFCNARNEGNRSSRPRVISLEVMSPETWVMLPEILVMSPEKKSQVARRNKYWKDQNFRLLIGNNVVKFLSLKRSLFPTKPWRFLERCSFLTTKGSVFRF